MRLMYVMGCCFLNVCSIDKCLNAVISAAIWPRLKNESSEWKLFPGVS